MPGYPLGGCGSVTAGQLCECKDRVMGRICDVCKPGYWNLDRNNLLGCEGKISKVKDKIPVNDAKVRLPNSKVEFPTTKVRFPTARGRFLTIYFIKGVPLL